MEYKICKICNETKLNDLTNNKKYMKTCRKCQSKINYEAYKDKFKEYYIKDQEKRLEYQIAYHQRTKKTTNNKRGRPRIINVSVESIEESESV